MQLSTNKDLYYGLKKNKIGRDKNNPDGPEHKWLSPPDVYLSGLTHWI